MRFLPDDDMTVAVIGFGYVGSCLAATLADRGCDVIGIDTNDTLVAETLPPRYNDESELTLEVQPGENQKDYSLTTK